MTSRKILFVALFLAAAPIASAQEFFFKKNDVVVIMGDSITEQRLYSNYLEIWSQTRFPAHNLTFRNVGIGGDTSGGGNGRFKRDVLTHKATALTVDFGMNDGRYIWPGKIQKGIDAKKKATEREITATDVESAYATYMKGQQGIADQAKAANIRVAWITPQPVEHNPGDINEKYNATLEKFGNGVAEIAKKNDGLSVDQFRPYWTVIENARKAGEKKRITAGDAVHPGPPGQAMMAAAILKGLHFPREVSSVDITIGGNVETKNCKVDNLSAGGDGLDVAFSREDQALPYFPMEERASVVHISPEDMNYSAKIVGLAGKYAVKIGDAKSLSIRKGIGCGSQSRPPLATGRVADQVRTLEAVNDKTGHYHAKSTARRVEPWRRMS